MRLQLQIAVRFRNPFGSGRALVGGDYEPAPGKFPVCFLGSGAKLERES